ncbi:glycoside hydrolase family 27 protein [Puia dinghuensis]|uniref:Alpha-galactosidase n=1 Tax=Puia dinghuensis TaxID=1792502 RepID=A0A8J2XVU7_9BACT|nr:glycoside hydrolase family 27 protein [Puia dinghuensis]GGB14432.1 hypothetical protein GCM10011511_42820 [Puia dinghuensis]
MKKITRQSVIFLAMLSCIAFFCVSTVEAQKFDGLAMTPPMGWNSWNKFACDGINETVIRQMADAMAANGMQQAGYQYIVIDDCWQVGRDSAGNIIADAVKFPHGIKALADYIHSKGLKFGIYTCAGTKTCAGRPASLGYEFQDARQYAAWGVDYLKEDWCNVLPAQSAEASYTLMRDALHAAGHPIVFSLCEWGSNKPWHWATNVGHLWRTTGDIQDRWSYTEAGNGSSYGGSVLANLDLQKGLEQYAAPGHWNDPDMLEVGNGGLTPEEDKSHFTLWCMLAAPLMTGNDLRSMSETTKAILTNRDVIAIDQDPLGRQGYEVAFNHDLEVFIKPLSGGDTAVCLFNRSDEPKKVDFQWSQYKIGSGLAIRDVWKGQQQGTTATPYRGEIPKHGVILLRLSHR